MKTEWKGGTLLAPVPVVMATVGTMEHADIITVGWTGIVCSEPPKTYISVRPERYSHGLLMEHRAFVINMTTAALAEVCDYCGMVTGRKVDKWAKCGLTKEASSTVVCPRIGESPLSLECKVTDVLSLGSHDMFLADITRVVLEESLLDADGKLDLGRAGLCCYAHGTYYAVGEMLGKFGYSMAEHKKGKNARVSAGDRKK